MIRIIFLVFISSQLFSQNVTFKGTLLNIKSNKPVVYANISFLTKNVGTSTLENGTFTLTINKKLLKEKVHISCLNYKDTIVSAKYLHTKLFFLEPKEIQLKEIIVSKKIEKEKVVSAIKNRNVSIGLSGRMEVPWAVARYFKYTPAYKETPYVKSVTVFLVERQKQQSKFRIRVFLKDTVLNLPAEDLLTQNVVVFVSKRQKKIQIDLSAYDLEMPKEGVFVALERLHIPYNFYLDVVHFKDSIRENIIGVRPKFGGILDENEKRYSFKNGIWKTVEKDTPISKNKTVVPAISLTLSN